MGTPGIGSVENMEKRPGCSRTFGIKKAGYAGLKYVRSTENFRKLFLQINQSCSTLIYFIQSKVSLKKNGLTSCSSSCPLLVTPSTRCLVRFKMP